MVTYCWIAFEQLDKGDKTGFQRMMDEMPEGARWQLANGYFEDVQKVCAHRIEAEPARRPVNGLNVEWSFEHKRCLRQSPDGRGLAYWASGGDIAAYGACCLANCPIGRNVPQEAR
jgi:hypothetical protein